MRCSKYTPMDKRAVLNDLARYEWSVQTSVGGKFVELAGSRGERESTRMQRERRYGICTNFLLVYSDCRQWSVSSCMAAWAAEV